MGDSADYAQRWERAPKHVVSAAAVVVNETNELLLIRSPMRGWEIPGGQVEQGETLRGAAIRETFEESGVEIEIVGFCGVFQNITRSVCNFLFLGTPTGGSPRLSDESIEVAWVALPHALELVTFPTFRQRIELSLDRPSWPFLVEFT
jgi:ADP-ribose pyrophosphatase YjhB (NUDIX family)